MPEYLDGTPIQVPQSIRISVLEANSPERWIQIGTIGVSSYGHVAYGMQPSAYGTEKYGECVYL